MQVYLYKKGFVHSKVWVADGEWASVGTANLDIRSMYLNFESWLRLLWMRRFYCGARHYSLRYLLSNCVNARSVGASRHA